MAYFIGAASLALVGYVYILKQDEERNKRRVVEAHKAFERWAIKDRELLDRMYGNGPISKETREQILIERQQNEDDLDNF